jgi:hypothetical protein
MKLVSISVMKNEADVAELFVRHHLAYFDSMIIVDHGSTDSSPRIIENLRDAGLAVELHYDHHLEFRQKALVNEYAQKCVSGQAADWLFPLDLDEFLTVDNDIDLRGFLQQQRRDKPLYVPWRTYAPTRDDLFEEKNLLKRIQHRLATETQQYYKVIVPVPLYASGRYQIDAGSHSLVDKQNKTIDGVCLEKIHLAHFPVRTPEQIAGKILSGWLTRRADAGHRKNESYHLKVLFDQFLAGRPIGYGELQEIALNYLADGNMTSAIDLVRDPLPEVFDNRQISSAMTYEVNPVSTALGTAEKLAEELCELKKQQSRGKHSKWLGKFLK